MRKLADNCVGGLLRLNSGSARHLLPFIDVGMREWRNRDRQIRRPALLQWTLSALIGSD
jgi:hypothetical protein